MYLLDTDVLSHLRRPAQVDPHVAAWVKQVPPADMFLSVISIMEVEIGAQLKARHDPAQGTALRRWIEMRVLRAFRERILPIDLAIAQRCASMHIPGRQPDRDALIAATADVHGLVVVTRNVKDFQPLGVRLLNPWEG